MDQDWPVASGDYVLGNGSSPVAVLIVGRGAVEVPTELFRIKGILKTENIGLEKVIANIVSCPGIRVLVVCGKEEFGHFPGRAINALMQNGVDEHHRILGTDSAIPFLCDISLEAIERFRKQVIVIDLLDSSNVNELVEYDPIYEFSVRSKEALLTELRRLASERFDPFHGEPVITGTKALRGDGMEIAKQLHKASDEFITPMLRLPSDGLNTGMGMVLISEEFGVVIEPLQGRVIAVPSIEFAMRLRSYLTGV